MKNIPKPLWTRCSPRMCMTDAYTASAGCFDSQRALEFSEYYMTFRKFVGNSKTVNNMSVFKDGDNRMLFFGLRPILERIFIDPVTHEEIDEARDFYKNRKAMSNGSFSDFEFMEPLWRRVVDEFEGYPPIRIDALPEGSVCYPNEPFMRVRNTVKGFGPLAVWFESSLMKVWNASQRGTYNRHWLDRVREMIQKTDASISPEMLDYWSRAYCHDFSARATGTDEENAHCATYDMMVFNGTDTFDGAFYAWLDGASNSIGNSVWAGAHHSVQGYENESDFFNTIYNNAPDNSIVSMIGDCYDWNYAVDNHLLRLAQVSREKNNGKIVVARPDSSDNLTEKCDQMIVFCKKAVELGLFTEKMGADGKMYKFGTFARMIQGDSMDYEQMNYIDNMMIASGFAPHGWYVYGFGGSRIRSINRDVTSTKFALCSVGKNRDPVIKLSMTDGKRTRPVCKVIRNSHSLKNGATVVSLEEEGDDAFVNYFDGTSENPFGPGFEEDFNTIRNRSNNEFEKMPMNAGFMSEKLSLMSDSIANSIRQERK